MNHGGKREKAGRPKGTTKYGETTHPVRIPQSRIEEVKSFLARGFEQVRIPLFSSTVRAGLPTTADDLIEDYIDLNSMLSGDPGTTFLVRAAGDSMIDTPIFEGDMLVVERNNTPISGKIVIAALGDELTVKRLLIETDHIKLIAENPAYPPIIIENTTHFKILGVVTHIIHRTK
ncbi:MAG: translesion error-prone DNA polymerase V autoproteolytic subunit [Legionella sp.]|nr:translesion error-prone DNA polymerase V autoproteolytic subunit [Legionella sp.]